MAKKNKFEEIWGIDVRVVDACVWVVTQDVPEV